MSNDILKRLIGDMARMFPTFEPEAESTPPHLRPLPAAGVTELCTRLADEPDVRASYGTMLELRAAQESRTPHDLRRLANALTHVVKRLDLADQVTFLVAKGHLP